MAKTIVSRLVLPDELVVHQGEKTGYCYIIIVYCKSGRRSAAAAYLPREHHIVAFSLRGGIEAWPCRTEAGIAT